MDGIDLVSLGSGELPGDALVLPQQAGVDGGRVHAPAGGQQGDPLGVDRGRVGPAEVHSLLRIRVSKTFQTELEFSLAQRALVPDGLSGPGVGSLDVALFRTHPGV